MKLRLLALFILIAFGASAQTTPWSTSPATVQTRMFSGIFKIRWLVGNHLYSPLDSISGGGGTTTYPLTVNNSGTGDASSFIFNGAAARTLSYNSIGAQAALVSGANIKTINSVSILGSGNIVTSNIGNADLSLAGSRILNTNTHPFTINSDGGNTFYSQQDGQGIHIASFDGSSYQGFLNVNNGQTNIGIEDGFSSPLQTLNFLSTGGVYTDAINNSPLSYAIDYTPNTLINWLNWKTQPAVVIPNVASVNALIAGGNNVYVATAAALPTSTYHGPSGGNPPYIQASSNGVLTVDGVVVPFNATVLVKDEGNLRNGTYFLSTSGSVSVPFILTRTNSYPVSMVAGSQVYVQLGTANAGKIFIQTTTGTPVIGTTVFSYTALSGGSSGTMTSITPGVGFLSHTPITVSGTMDIDTAATIVSKTFAGRYVKTNTAASLASLSLSGTAGAGLIDLIAQSSDPATPATGHNIIFADASGRFSVKGSNGFDWTVSKSLLTATRVQLVPDSAGTYALESRIIPNASLQNPSITIQGASTALGGSVNVINGTGFVKATGTTISYDNSTYITGNQTITFTPTGDVTGSTTGTTSLTPSLSIGAGKVVNSMIATGTIDLTTKVTGTLPTGNGGTGLAAFTTGDILYTSATNTLSALGIGATNRILSVVGGIPAWVTNVTLGTISSSAIVASSTVTSQRASLGATTSDGFIITNATAATNGTRLQSGGAFRGIGAIWNLSGTPASNQFDWRMYTTGVSATTPTTSIVWQSSLVTNTTPVYTDRASLDNSGNFSLLTGTLILHGYTVSTLPTGVTGMTAYVTDALTPSFGTTLVGGGAIVTKAFYNGTNWIAE